MKKEKIENLEDELNKKIRRREKKKRPKMKVSGKRIFQLKKIISNK